MVQARRRAGHARPLRRNRWGKVGDAGRVGGRHVCRPYMGDLAGVRGNTGNVQRRVKPPPYNNGRLNRSNGKVEGRACPAPTAQQMGESW